MPASDESLDVAVRSLLATASFREVTISRMAVRRGAEDLGSRTMRQAAHRPEAAPSQSCSTPFTTLRSSPPTTNGRRRSTARSSGSVSSARSGESHGDPGNATWRSGTQVTASSCFRSRTPHLGPQGQRRRVCVIWPSLVSNLDAVVAHLRDREGSTSNTVRVDEHTGARFTFFRDPDGLPLELYEADQRT